MDRSAAGEGDAQLLGRLRAGNESAFVELVGRHHHAMVRLARTYVPSEAVAEEVVQETWLAALRGLSGFEGRAAVRTWLYRILVNRARSVGTNEHKHLPVGDVDPAVDSSRFRRDGSWSYPPAPWVDDVEDRVHAESMAKSIRKAIDDLPAPQRAVLTLRDVEGMTAGEACHVLHIADGHQRVLLHRARSRLRNALEAEFAGTRS